MRFPKPFLGRAIIEALDQKSEEFLRTQYKEKMAKSGVDITKSSLILDDETIYTREITTDMNTGKQILGKNKADNRVPLFKGKILHTAPDFCGERFLANNPDAGQTPTIGDIVWFIPNETMAMDSSRKYHLINDCDIVAFESGE